MFKISTILLLSAFVIVGGCDRGKGKGFVGHWIGQDAASTSALDIVYDDGLFHIDHHYLDKYLGGKKVDKLEAKAVSNNVLEINAELGSVDMRLEGDTLFLENEKYQKSK